MADVKEIHATIWKEDGKRESSDKYGFKKMLSQLIEEHPEILTSSRPKTNEVSK